MALEGVRYGSVSNPSWLWEESITSKRLALASPVFKNLKHKKKVNNMSKYFGQKHQYLKLGK